MRIINEGKQPYHYLNEDGVIVSTKHTMGWADSLGRTSMGALIYDNVNAANIQQNYNLCRTSPEAGDQWYVCRYPDDFVAGLIGCSRDHVIYSITALKLLGEHEFVKEFIKNKAKRPSIDLVYTIDQKMWFKALYSRRWSNVYACFMGPYMRLIQGLKWVWRKLGQRGDDILPTYAAFYSLFGLQAVEGNWAKRVLRRVFRPHFEDSNLAARMLCDEYVTKAEVDDYVPTRSNRWLTRVDREKNRNLTPFPEDTAENNIEMGLLAYLYENQTKQI